MSSLYRGNNETAPLNAVQPFRSGGKHYRSACIQDVDVHYEEPSIIMKSNQLWEVLSNAVHQGGLVKANTAVNVRVPLTYESEEPQHDFMRFLHNRQLSPAHTTGFMTAAKLSHAACCDYAAEDFSLLAIATAGTSNAARAGLERDTYPGYHAGTINLFLWIDGRMSQAAMVNAMMTATEAKCAALADVGVMDSVHDLVATGTTTDAVCLAVSQSARYMHEHAYAGTATTLGCQLARLVYAVIYKAVYTQQHD